MKNIFFLMPRFGMGGIAKMACFVANTYAKNGYSCICCSLAPDEVTVKFNPEIEKICLNYDIPKISQGRVLFRIIEKINLLYKLRKILIQRDIGIICAFGTDLIRIATYAGLLLDKKIIGSERGNPFAYSQRQHKKYLKAMKKCEIVVFQTFNARTAFEISQEKAVVIPNPAILRGDKIPLFNGIDRKNRIVSCGRLSSEKNFKLLIDAFSKMSNKQFELLIYGEGPDYTSLNNYIHEKNTQSKIKIIRGCHDVFKCEYDSAMFVLPSNTEGMPNALMEAMSLGIPCIATDCPSGGVRELLDSGRRGILVPVNNIEKLREAMDFYAENPSIAKEYGEKSLEIHKDYSPQIIGNKWLEVLYRVEKTLL